MESLEGFTHINKHKIYYKTINTQAATADQPLLVFLHEGLGCTEIWKDFPETLCQWTDCPGLIYDRKRYGKSDPCSRAFGNNFMHEEALDDLPQLFENLEIKKPIILIGHSDGGSIALLHAAAFPERVLGVISEADHVFSEEITRQGIENMLTQYKEGKLRNRLQRYHYDKTDDLVYGWSGFLLSDEGKNWNIIDQLGEIKCPVLLIQGKEDQFGSYEQLALKLKHIKSDTSVLFLNNCGHIPHYEQKDQVLSQMKYFIEKLKLKPLYQKPNIKTLKL